MQFERRTEASAVRRASSDPTPTKRANKVDAQYALAAESAEGRRPAKGNALQAYLRRTQGRGCESQGLWRVRQARAAGRHMNPRQEPYEVIPHVRIRAGGRSQGRSLPRLTRFWICRFPIRKERVWIKGTLPLCGQFFYQACKVLFTHFAGGHPKHGIFQSASWVQQTDAVEFQKHEGGSKRRSLVTVHEGMVLT